MIQSPYHFGVFRTEFINQRIGLFGERFDRVEIVLLLTGFDLSVELT